MGLLATVLTLISALEHVAFFVLESILWKKPIGRKVFRLDEAKAETTAELAVNQGVYNLFLAAGLFWGAVASPPLQTPLRVFFLGCVVVAAVVGAVTVNRRILLVQGLAAALALIATVLA